MEFDFFLFNSKAADGYEAIEKEPTRDQYERETLEGTIKTARINKQDFEMLRQVKPTHKFE
jgi:hypothetical protein